MLQTNQTTTCPFVFHVSLALSGSVMFMFIDATSSVQPSAGRDRWEGEGGREREREQASTRLMPAKRCRKRSDGVSARIIPSLVYHGYCLSLLGACVGTCELGPGIRPDVRI